MAISGDSKQSKATINKTYAQIGAFLTGAALVANKVVESSNEKAQAKREYESVLADTQLSLSKARLAYLSGGVSISGTAALQEDYVLDNLFTSRALSRKMLNYRTINRVLAATVEGTYGLYRTGFFDGSRRKNNV